MSADKPIFARGMVTDWLLDMLGVALNPGIKVGDAQAPADGGWPTGQPGEGTFVPYVDLMTGPAAPAMKGTLATAEPDAWTLRYQLVSQGGLREQADDTADFARKAWDSQGEVRLDVACPTQWKAYSFIVVSMGAVVGSDLVQPMWWTVKDEVSLTLTRCRT